VATLDITPLSLRVTSTHTTYASTPDQAYIDWATELGVSTTATLLTFLDDDMAWTSTLQAKLDASAPNSNFFISSEAGLGFYLSSGYIDGSSALLYSEFSGIVGRFYGINTRPDLILTYHPAEDLATYQGKLQKAGTTTIIFAKHGKFNDQNVAQVRVAAKITPNEVRLIVRAYDMAVPIKMVEMLPGATAVQEYVDAFSQGSSTTYEHVFTLGPLSVNGRIAGPSILGAPTMHGPLTISGRVSDSGPLRAFQGLASVPPAGRIAAATMLGAPSAMGSLALNGRIAVGSPLGLPVVHGVHDFTTAIGEVITSYAMDLIGPGGTVRVPISSWQATLQTGAACYAQCVIPACAPWVDTINAATQFVIFRRATLPAGSTLEYEMVRAPMQTASFDRGPQRYTCSISGYSAALTAVADPPAVYDRQLTGVRTTSRTGAAIRARCSIDWLLRPGHRAFLDGQPLIVDYINYYVNESDTYCDVGSRA